MGMGGLFDNLKSFIAKDADRHLGNCTERYMMLIICCRTNGNVCAVCGADCFSSQKNIPVCHAIQLYSYRCRMNGNAGAAACTGPQVEAICTTDCTHISIRSAAYY